MSETLEERILHAWKGWMTVEKGASAATRAAYLSDIRQLLDRLEQESISLIDCRREHLEEILIAWGKEGLEASSVARKLSALRNFFKRMVEEGFRSDDPTELLHASQKGRYLPDALSIQQVEQILEGIDLESRGGLRDRALIELLYGAGLRISEAVGLTLEQLRLDEGWILVQGKGSKQRLAPIGSQAAAMVERYHQEERPLLNPTGDRLILNLRGNPLSRVGAWMIIKKRSEEIDPSVSPHTFRHSYATHLLEGGIDLRVLQELLGHADVSTTQIYTHLDRTHLKEIHTLYHPREQKPRK